MLVYRRVNPSTTEIRRLYTLVERGAVYLTTALNLKTKGVFIHLLFNAQLHNNNIIIKNL